ncbi:putative NLI interacting factor-like phosphatase 2 [Elsinoe fawcettii]|nr:putative NLI interacting factor-like phosphatase 2 [Elsinoe fawcettii]
MDPFVRGVPLPLPLTNVTSQDGHRSESSQGSSNANHTQQNSVSRFAPVAQMVGSSDVQPAANAFTYVNPFDQLMATAPVTSSTARPLAQPKKPKNRDLRKDKASTMTSKDNSVKKEDNITDRTASSTSAPKHKYNTRSKTTIKAVPNPTAPHFVAKAQHPHHQDIPRGASVGDTADHLTQLSLTSTDIADQLTKLSLAGDKPPKTRTKKKNESKAQAPKVAEAPTSIAKAKGSFTPRGSSRRAPPPERMAIPHPSPEYMTHCAASSPIPSEPRRLLIILDINGTLGYRPSRQNIRARPHLAAFLEYIFREHDVAIWTSMQRGNFEKVLQMMTKESQREKLKLIWTREDMNLGKNFGEYVQTYKELTKFWARLAELEAVQGDGRLSIAPQDDQNGPGTSYHDHQNRHHSLDPHPTHQPFTPINPTGTSQPPHRPAITNNYYQTLLASQSANYQPSHLVPPPSSSDTIPPPPPAFFDSNIPPPSISAAQPFRPIPTTNTTPSAHPSSSLPATGNPRYNVSNTLLIDDSFKKAVSEPYNHVVVTEWEGPTRGEGMDDMELLRVMDLIERLRRIDDVARGMYWGFGAGDMGPGEGRGVSG